MTGADCIPKRHQPAFCCQTRLAKDVSQDAQPSLSRIPSLAGTVHLLAHEYARIWCLFVGVDLGRRVWHEVARCETGLRLDTFAAFGGAMTAVRLPLLDCYVFAARRGRAGNQFGPDGARALAEALKENTSLTTLNVKGAYVVARALLMAYQCAILP
eukprot:596231-Pleurochrysis_carterae.AAC.1